MNVSCDRCLYSLCGDGTLFMMGKGWRKSARSVGPGRADAIFMPFLVFSGPKMFLSPQCAIGPESYPKDIVSKSILMHTPDVCVLELKGLFRGCQIKCSSRCRCQWPQTVAPQMRQSAGLGLNKEDRANSIFAIDDLQRAIIQYRLCNMLCSIPTPKS
jgi:hypothetical protein